MSKKHESVLENVKNTVKSMERKERFSKETKMILISLFILALGIIFLLTSLLLESYNNNIEVAVSTIPQAETTYVESQQKNPQESSGTIRLPINLCEKIFIPFFSNAASILIAFAIGNLILDRYSNLNYFKERISELFLDYKMVNILDDSYKRLLKRNIIKSTFGVENDDADELTYLLDDEINIMLETYYYSENYTVINCSIIEDQGEYIKKIITKELTIKNINPSKKCEFSDLLHIRCKELENDSLNPLTINSVIINNEKELTQNDYQDTNNQEELLSSSSSHPYNINKTYKLKNPIEIKDSLKVKIKYTTITPIDDRSYSCRMDKLCKNMRCKFLFEDPIKIESCGFSFASNQKNSLRPEYHKNICEVQSNNWILPGEGVVFTIFTPQNDSFNKN